MRVNIFNNNIKNNLQNISNNLYSQNQIKQNNYIEIQTNNINNKHINFNEEFRNKIPIDNRLVICLKNLGLNNYIKIFVNLGINFEDLLGLTNKDMKMMNIPLNAQKIIKQFTIEYLNNASLYTKEEIMKFFMIKRNKNNKMLRMFNNSKCNRRRPNSVDNKSSQLNNFTTNNINNNIVSFRNNQNINLQNRRMIDNRNNRNNNFQNNQKNYYRKPINSAKSNYRNYILTNDKQSNKKNIIKKNNNYNNINYNNKNVNIHQVKNNNSLVSNSTNKSNINQIRDSFDYNLNKRINTMPNDNNGKLKTFYNNNNIKTIVDNCSHLAMKGSNNNILNYFKEVNKDSQILRKNLRENNENSSIIIQMNNIINRGKQRKNYYARGNNININPNNINYNYINENTQSSIVSGNKNGYYSDSYITEQNYKKNMSKNDLFNNGYEINTYYAGDSNSMRKADSNKEIQRINGKNGRIYYSKENKIKKTNEIQTKKVEKLLQKPMSSIEQNRQNVRQNSLQNKKVLKNNYVNNNISKKNNMNKNNLVNLNKIEKIFDTNNNNELFNDSNKMNSNFTNFNNFNYRSSKQYTLNKNIGDVDKLNMFRTGGIENFKSKNKRENNYISKDNISYSDRNSINYSNNNGNSFNPYQINDNKNNYMQQNNKINNRNNYNVYKNYNNCNKIFNDNNNYNNLRYNKSNNKNNVNNNISLPHSQVQQIEFINNNIKRRKDNSCNYKTISGRPNNNINNKNNIMANIRKSSYNKNNYHNMNEIFNYKTRTINNNKDIYFNPNLPLNDEINNYILLNNGY